MKSCGSYDEHRSLPCRWRTAENGSISTRLWIAPPTRMDEHQLMEEGYYSIYGKAGARLRCRCSSWVTKHGLLIFSCCFNINPELPESSWHWGKCVSASAEPQRSHPSSVNYRLLQNTELPRTSTRCLITSTVT